MKKEFEEVTSNDKTSADVFEIKNSKDDKSSTEIISFVIIGLGILLIIIAIVAFLSNDTDFNYSSKIQSDKWGQVGDFIGGTAGTIWALAGMLLFYVALKEQRKDIKINKDTLVLQVEALNQQVKEFRSQTKELESSRKVYEQQNKTIRVQQFESHFYSVFDVYLKIKDGLNNYDEDNDYFKTVYSKLKKAYAISSDVKKHHQIMIDSYLEVFNSERGSLPQFFKLFYRLMKIIEENPFLLDDEKMQYAKIFRSQLTDYEQLVIQYNSYSDYGVKARPMILKYNFLKHSPLFQKPHFECFLRIHKDIDLLMFTDHLSDFLVFGIMELSDFSYENDSYGEIEKTFNCMMVLSYVDNYKLEIECKNNIIDNGIKLSDNDFFELINNIICEKLIFTSYTSTDKIKTTGTIVQKQSNKVFSFEIEIEEDVLLNLNHNN